jgi:mono/diheme cytochrome c family protein
MMSSSVRNIAVIRAVPLLFWAALATGSAWPGTADSEAAAAKAASGAVQSWSKVRAELPTSQTLFPPGNGADIANAQCLICHSAEMVLLQPALTQDQWAGEIDKMRNAYGAPLPPDQVGALARYLLSINGRHPPGG